MIADFLLCWYAMAWVACGSVFAHDRHLNRFSIAMCFLFPMICLPAILVWRVRHLQPLDTSKQYLWRSPQ